jgi:hypothetical protein
LIDPRFKCICYTGEKPSPLARNCARPGGKCIGRGFHGARDIFGAAPRHLGDWTPVRWIFNFEPLARNAVDPFAADQHAFLLRRGLVFAYFGDSRHHHLHRFSVTASADVGCPSLGFSLTDSLGFGRQLKNRRLLTLIKECQKHNPAIWKFQRIVMGGDLFFVDLPKDCSLVVDHFTPPAHQTSR